MRSSEPSPKISLAMGLALMAVSWTCLHLELLTVWAYAIYAPLMVGAFGFGHGLSRWKPWARDLRPPGGPEAVPKVRGPVASRRLDDEPLEVRVRRACFHEVGHLVALAYDPFLHRVVSVTHDGQGNGRVAYVRTIPFQVRMWAMASHGIRERFRISREKLEDDMVWTMLVTKLGGIAAEAVHMKSFQTRHVSEDLLTAVASIRDLKRPDVCPWPASGLAEPTIDLSIAIQNPTEVEARVLNLAYRRAKHLIGLHKTQMEAVAEHLHVHGSLEPERMDELLERIGHAPAKKP